MHLDTEHWAGAPAGEAGSTMQGVPGFVTQGDVLAMIGPALTTRGDTFLIRAFGESGSDSANPQGKAWLEAVVQRVYEPVTPADPTADVTDPERWRPADSFGRKFEIVSVRWLTQDEI
jgi:hypothetical protein